MHDRSAARADVVSRAARGTGACVPRHGAPVPDTLDEAGLRADPARLGWPIFAKPIDGSASRGLAVYAGPDDLPESFREPMMFQPRLSGPEYTVNMFIGRAGVLRCAVPHRRLQIRAGEVEKGRTTCRDDLRALAVACVDVYGPRLIATPCSALPEVRNCGRISGFCERPDPSSPRAPMDFRVLSPQCPQDISECHAGPHIRFRKRWERPFHHPQPSCCNFRAQRPT